MKLQDPEIAQQQSKQRVIKVVGWVVVLVIIVAGAVATPYVLEAYHQNVALRKKADVKKLMSQVRMYMVTHDSTPKNVTDGWCVVGVRYQDGICLSELLASGIALPISPDDEEYYYFASQDYVIVATRLNPPESGPGKHVGICADGRGERVWCEEIKRLNGVDRHLDTQS